MKLSTLCRDIVDIQPKYDMDITGLALDSREVKNGYLFLACPGAVVDGHEFIGVAIEKGANAVLCEASEHIFDEAHVTTEAGKIIPIISVPHLLQLAARLAATFYHDPSAHMQVIGVTGTNGKTSLTHYLADGWSRLDHPCAVIGTVGNGFLNHLQSSTHTTPNPIALQHMLATLKQEGAKSIAMEVSSHGLVQGRSNAIHFDTAIFTNLSRDHLDYHGTMENYAAAKRKLFQMEGLKQAVFNVDDAFGVSLLNEFVDQYPCYAYSINKDAPKIANVPFIHADHIECTSQGMTAHITTPWGEGELQLQLFGIFNLSNILAVITCLGIHGIPLTKILTTVSQLKGVKGRMELFHTAHSPKVLVDYSHTPDALEKALQAIKSHVTGKIWCVFGCGGDRDRGKRPQMGRIAEHYADHLIVTNDNPRHESPEAIAQQILAGTQHPERVQLMLDREAAIRYAVKHASEKDVILVAGKGHENYQQFGDEKLAFSDQEVVGSALNINSGC